MISVTGTTLQEQVEGLQNEYEFRDDSVEETIEAYITDMREYAGIVQQVSAEMPAENAISTLAGPEFAQHLN